MCPDALALVVNVEAALTVEQASEVSVSNRVHAFIVKESPDARPGLCGVQILESVAERLVMLWRAPRQIQGNPHQLLILQQVAACGVGFDDR